MCGIWHYSVSSTRQCRSNLIFAFLTGCFSYRNNIKNAASFEIVGEAGQVPAPSTTNGSTGLAPPWRTKPFTASRHLTRDRFCHPWQTCCENISHNLYTSASIKPATSHVHAKDTFPAQHSKRQVLNTKEQKRLAASTDAATSTSSAALTHRRSSRMNGAERSAQFSSPRPQNRCTPAPPAAGLFRSN